MIFPPNTALGGFVHGNIRKIAHFAEYGLLGAEIAVFVMFYLQKRRQKALASLPLAVCVAVFDETLQYFSGRGPAVLDVWIDLGGFAFASLVTYGIILLVLKLIDRYRTRTSTMEARNGQGHKR